VVARLLARLAALVTRAAPSDYADVSRLGISGGVHRSPGGSLGRLDAYHNFIQCFALFEKLCGRLLLFID